MNTDIAYAALTLTELFHHSREDGMYGDLQLDKAMKGLLGEVSFNWEKEQLKKGGHKGNLLGMVAHSVINKNCQ